MNVPAIVTISRISDGSDVLGPGRRAVVWVRGCPLRCAGCIAPEDLPFTGGIAMPVADLAARLEAVTGVTFSGGEPMAQAAGLVELVDRLRGGRDWSVMSYSGYTIEHLRRHGTSDQKALLERLDILVDGPYQQDRHASLRWRGSANQRLHYLTARHRPEADDTSAGLEFEVHDGAVQWTGVPAVPDLRSRFEAAMAAAGVNVEVEDNTDVRKP